MLNFEKEQKEISVGKVKIGGQPGQNPTVMVGTVFYKNHSALVNEKTGEMDKAVVEKEVNEFMEIIDDTGMQAVIDVVGASPEALYKECEYIADLVDVPFLCDGLNDSIRIPAIEKLRDSGLIDRAILNSIDENTNEENLNKLKEIGVKNAVLLLFGNRYILPKLKMKLLKDTLIPKAEKAGIDNFIIDTAVLDLASIPICAQTVMNIKNELGVPSGFAPSNAIYAWKFGKKQGDVSRCGAIASICTYTINAGSDFVLFGPIKFAKCVVPALALVDGINAYYRKRILRKPISDETPFKHIF